MRRLFLSFSGGETSAFMCWAILNSDFRNRYDDIRVVFANTGQENEATLQFVQKCDEAFGLNVTWIEADVQHGVRVSPKARVVTFETASRNGEPFESAIRKYGIPGPAFPHCTRSLKIDPMTSYMRSIGWVKGSYDTAVGIRNDEIDRMSVSAAKRRIIYPLIQWLPTTKPEINNWWRKQPFRLGLKGYQGNCKWCWKKSMRKHLTIMQETPEAYEFPARMEALYPKVGPEFHAMPDDYVRRFFRGSETTQDLRDRLTSAVGFVPATDDADVYMLFDPVLDLSSGCAESCEVFADEG